MQQRIAENKRKETVTIDGYRLNGLIADGVCPRCAGVLIYHEDFDADFCPACNAWRDTHCSDPSCTYCRRRPARPLPEAT